MNVYDTANRLAEELKQSEEYSNYKMAKETLNINHDLKNKIKEFEEANLYCYEEFVSLLKHWKKEIINSFRRLYGNRKQTNALAESINQKLRELLRVSYGYANFERFRARALYCLSKKVFYSLTVSIGTLKRQGSKRHHYNKTKNTLKE